VQDEARGWGGGTIKSHDLLGYVRFRVLRQGEKFGTNMGISKMQGWGAGIRGAFKEPKSRRQMIPKEAIRVSGKPRGRRRKPNQGKR